MLSLALVAQAGDPKDLLLKRLNEQFAPTKFTADKSNVVTAGAVVALQKDGLLVYSVTVPSAPISVYKNGKLSQGFGDTLKVDMVDGLGRDGGSASIPRKTLVTGEKFWVSSIELGKDAIYIQITTDPYDDGRYFGMLKFLVPKGTIPSPDDAVKAVSEVLQAQAAENQPAPDQSAQSGQGGQMAPLPPPGPAPAKYAEVDAPPPPPPPPPTVSLGQTKAQVSAAFGDPVRKAVIGPKEIFFYKDMKVTFTNGKVSNIQ
jgi:hypothetical protein